MRQAGAGRVERVTGTIGRFVLVTVAGAAAIGCVRSVEARAANWWAVDTAHVHLETDVGRDRAADSAWALEDLRGALARVFFECDSLESAERIEVVLLSNDGEYDEVAPPHTAGFFDPGTWGVAAVPPRIVVRGSRSRGMAQIFVHEMTHRFVAQCFPDAPVWLHEGLATYFETIRVRTDDVVVGIASFRFTDTQYAFRYYADGLDRFEIPRSLVPTARALVTMPPRDFYRTNASDASITAGDARLARYAGAWALVHMLLLGPDHALRDRLTAYLAGLADARDDGAHAFVLAFQDVPLDEAFASFLDRWDLRERHVEYAPGPIPEPQPIALAPGVAHVRWAELYAAGSPPSEERRDVHLAAAEASAEGRARALLLRATWAGFAAGAPFVATAAAVAPDDLDVLRARAMMTVGPAVRGPDADALIASLRARTDFRVVDRVALAELLLSRGEADASLDEARAALERDPSSWRARLAAATASESLGRFADAARELRVVVHLASHHSPETASRLEAHVAELLAWAAARDREASAAASAPEAAPASSGTTPPTETSGGEAGGEEPQQTSSEPAGPGPGG